MELEYIKDAESKLGFSVGPVKEYLNWEEYEEYSEIILDRIRENNYVVYIKHTRVGDCAVTEDHIGDNIDKIMWVNAFGSRKFSEEFLEKWINQIDGFMISILHSLSIGFVERNIDKLDLNGICGNKKTSKETREFAQSLLRLKEMFE